jgi:hypothetical protein
MASYIQKLGRGGGEAMSWNRVNSIEEPCVLTKLQLDPSLMLRLISRNLLARSSMLIQ